MKKLFIKTHYLGYLILAAYLLMPVSMQASAPNLSTIRIELYKYLTGEKNQNSVKEILGNLDNKDKILEKLLISRNQDSALAAAIYGGNPRHIKELITYVSMKDKDLLTKLYTTHDKTWNLDPLRLAIRYYKSRSNNLEVIQAVINGLEEVDEGQLTTILTQKAKSFNTSFAQGVLSFFTDWKGNTNPIISYLLATSMAHSNPKKILANVNEAYRTHFKGVRTNEKHIIIPCNSTKTANSGHIRVKKSTSDERINNALTNYEVENILKIILNLVENRSYHSLELILRERDASGFSAMHWATFAAQAGTAPGALTLIIDAIKKSQENVRNKSINIFLVKDNQGKTPLHYLAQFPDKLVQFPDREEIQLDVYEENILSPLAGIIAYAQEIGKLDQLVETYDTIKPYEKLSAAEREAMRCIGDILHSENKNGRSTIRVLEEKQKSSDHTDKYTIAGKSIITAIDDYKKKKEEEQKKRQAEYERREQERLEQLRTAQQAVQDQLNQAPVIEELSSDEDNPVAGPRAILPKPLVNATTSPAQPLEIRVPIKNTNEKPMPTQPTKASWQETAKDIALYAGVPLGAVLTLKVLYDNRKRIKHLLGFEEIDQEEPKNLDVQSNAPQISQETDNNEEESNETDSDDYGNIDNQYITPVSF